jgi:hypothetical protein
MSAGHHLPGARALPPLSPITLVESDLMMNALTQTVGELDLGTFIQLRREILKNPELGAHTPLTAELVASKLEDWG